MTAAETYLLLIAFVLFAALVGVIALWRGRSRDADRLAEKYAAEQAKTRHLTERVAEYRTEVARLSAYNGRLIADNAGLTDALDAINGEPTLTEAVYATLAELPVTHPEDPR